jgi:hypothetical protein
VATVHEGCVTVPITGACGRATTLNEKVAVAASQGNPRGLLVVTVIVTVLPASPVAGVYVNEKGDVFEFEGLIEPFPFSEIVTPVALPPKTFPLTVKGATPHIKPLALLSVSDGSLTQTQKTVN